MRNIVDRKAIPRIHGGTFAWAIMAVSLAISPGVASAQAMSARTRAVDIDLALEQAFTSVDGMGSPMGYRLGLALPWMIGPVGFDLGYRAVHEHLAEVAQRCGLTGCVPGPFEPVMQMRSVTLGVGWSWLLNPFVHMSIGVSGSLNWQDIRYDPGDRAVPSSSATAGPDGGIGGYASWRFPPLLSVLRPFLYTRADWIAPGECVADATCFGNRYVGSFGIGMYARIP